MIRAVETKNNSILEEVTGISFTQELAYHIEEKDYWAIKGKQYAMLEGNEQTCKEENIIETYITMRENKEQIFYLRYNKKEKKTYFYKKQLSSNGSYEVFAPLTRKQYKRLKNKDINWMRESNEPLFLEFYVKSQLFSWELDVTVEYKREKINVFCGDGDVSIYRNIQIKYKGKKLKECTNEIGKVLEIKYQDKLPVELQYMLQKKVEVACYWYQDYEQRRKNTFHLAGITGMLYQMFLSVAPWQTMQAIPSV